MTFGELIPRDWDRNPITKWADDFSFFPFRREMNRWFSDFARDFEAPMIEERTVGAYLPRVDVEETDKEIHVTAELPGVAEKDIELSLTNNVLTLKGEKKVEKEEKKKDYYRMERRYGAFHRAIPLPCEVKTEKIEAVFKDGILNIILPKAEEAKLGVKKIPIKPSK